MLSIPSAGQWGSSAQRGDQQGVCPGPHPDCKKSILGYQHGELGSSLVGIETHPSQDIAPYFALALQSQGWPSFTGVLLPARDLLYSEGRELKEETGPRAAGPAADICIVL